MPDFNPKAEAAALSKMLGTADIATVSDGGQAVAAKVLDEIKDEYCKLTADQQNKTVMELSVVKGLTIVSDGFGTNIGVTAKGFNDYPHVYASFVCEKKE
jgi:hypothetical protein